jgi:enoyl-CoA hydratase/carnithine racemase
VISAADAVDIGLFNRVVPAEELAGEVVAYAEAVARTPKDMFYPSTLAT